MKGWLVAGVLAVLLTASLYAWRGERGRADAYASEVDSIARVNTRLEVRQKADSAALEVERGAYSERLDSILRQRAREREAVAVATRDARRTADTLRARLIALGESTDVLDEHLAADAAKDSAHARELAAEDARWVAENALRIVTEQALASEQALRRGAQAEADALHRQVAALERADRWEKLAGGGGGCVVGALGGYLVTDKPIGAAAGCALGGTLGRGLLGWF